MTMDAFSGMCARETTGFMVIMHMVSNGSDVYFTGFDPNDGSITGKNRKQNIKPSCFQQ